MRRDKESTMLEVMYTVVMTIAGPTAAVGPLFIAVWKTAR